MLSVRRSVHFGPNWSPIDRRHSLTVSFPGSTLDAALLAYSSPSIAHSNTSGGDAPAPPPTLLAGRPAVGGTPPPLPAWGPLGPRRCLLWERRGRGAIGVVHTDHLGSTSGQTDVYGNPVNGSYTRFYAYGGLRAGDPAALFTAPRGHPTFTGNDRESRDGANGWFVGQINSRHPPIRGHIHHRTDGRQRQCGERQHHARTRRQGTQYGRKFETVAAAAGTDAHPSRSG